MDKIKIIIQTTLMIIIVPILIYVGSALTQIGNQIKSENKISGGLVATSQQTLGSAVSSTSFTVSTSSQQLLATAVVVRYFLAVCNNTSSTQWIALGATSTVGFQSNGLPITSNNCYEFSQGNGNLYTGPVSMASSSGILSGNVTVIEKSR